MPRLPGTPKPLGLTETVIVVLGSPGLHPPLPMMPVEKETIGKGCACALAAHKRNPTMAHQSFIAQSRSEVAHVNIEKIHVRCIRERCSTCACPSRSPYQGRCLGKILSPE